MFGFIRGTIAAAIRLAVFLAIIAGVMKVFFVDVYKVTHNGMAPTIVAGDEVLVWRDGNADMSNIMLCEHPSAPGELVIGRALAFAGHTVSADRFGNIYVDNDRTSTETTAQQRFYDVTRNKLFMMNLGNIQYAGLHTGTHTHEYYLEQEHTFSMRPYTVNRGVFLLGDNRSDEIDDSREFGEVDQYRCLGQIFMRWRPAPSNNDDIHHFYLDYLR